MQQPVQGPSAAYAKEMETLSTKESLLVALRDGGGFEGLVSGKITDMQRINVNERIVSLERLNPSPRPTTSPYLEGKWNFEWFGSALTAWFLFELSVEGAVRIKQEFVEGLLEVNEESVPQQQQLPLPFLAAAGFKLPLGGLSQRFFMISYLDDEILIIRDVCGAPQVFLTRLD